MPAVDEGTAAPRIVVGGPAAGFVDPATGLLTVAFDASGSQPTDPDNTSGLGFLYDVADGTIIAGTTTSAAITVTFPANTRHHRHVTLTATDLDNGKSTTRRIPVFSYDGVNTRPIPVRNISLTASKADGWGATIELAEGCDLDAVPEGALVVYWEREWYGDTEVSYGNAFAARSNIKFVGYLRRETIAISPEDDSLSFEAISPMSKLGELAGFAQALKTVGSPANWQQDQMASVWKILWYVLHYHSTWSVDHDMVITIPDYPYPENFVPPGTLLEQMRILTAVSATFTCDHRSFYVARNLQRATTAERNAAPTSLAITARDLAEVPSLTFEHSYQCNQLKGGRSMSSAIRCSPSRRAKRRRRRRTRALKND